MCTTPSHPPSSAALRPLAFIYDRDATRAHRLLDMRVDGCRNYAKRRDWDIAGTWLDRGTIALSCDVRPGFSSLLDHMGKASPTRKVLCLIHNWDRYANDRSSRTIFQQRIALAGGYTATTFDETDLSDVVALVGRQQSR
ncbi:hypothetical protein [Streptomyces sp. NPDC003077]|uniref:hypothetical protein n=1 Tax=Streptomyces sp. NPDC003077 TaxID=3154443 RepID=UPI0033A9B1DD